MLKAKYFILLICLSFLLKAEAKVTLTSIWGDNMVLQQQSEVTFSGTATSGKRGRNTRNIWNGTVTGSVSGLIRLELDRKSTRLNSSHCG